jgi:hypothetical protein
MIQHRRLTIRLIKPWIRSDPRLIISEIFRSYLTGYYSLLNSSCYKNKVVCGAVGDEITHVYNFMGFTELKELS